MAILDLWGVVLLCLGLWSIPQVNGEVCTEQCPDEEPKSEFNILDGVGDEVGIFDDLTKKEMQSVIDYMVDKSGLNLQMKNPMPPQNTLFLVEVLPPPKKAALHFLDDEGPRPARYAKAIVFRGEQNVVEEYKVGPLPNPTSHELLRYPNWRHPIPYSARSSISESEHPHLLNLLKRTFAPLVDFLTDITGCTADADRYLKDCVVYYPVWPASMDKTERKMIGYFLRVLDGYYLHPIGLQFRMDLLSLNTSHWGLDYLWFREQEFGSVQEFKEAYLNGTVENKKKMQNFDNLESNDLFSSLNLRGDPLPQKPLRGPMTFMPDGRRYSVQGHHIEWQGWSFDFNMRTATGVQAHDIRFHGNRVVYELALSQIGVLYSGHSPAAMYTDYLDTIIQLGRNTMELFPGLDCPDYADFFDFVHYLYYRPFVFKNSVCVFEMDKGIPLRRHYETDHMGSYHWVQGIADNVLVLRSFIAAYNYDYLIDVIFHQDGKLEVVCALSGYVVSSYRADARSDLHGYEIFPDGVGNMHNHVINFKVDMDIQGTSNRFESLDTKIRLEDSPIESGKKIYNRYFEKNLRETEMNATWNYNINTPKYLLFYNNDAEKNPYGNHKAYRLFPVEMSKLMLPEDWETEKSFQWARHQVAVTKRKDDEDTSSSFYNCNNPNDPVFQFISYITDDESIVDEDLVAWVTIGTLHIPHTEDIPTVTTPGVQLRIFLTPFNYFTEDPSLRSRDNIKIYPEENGQPRYEYAGIDPDVKCVPKNMIGQVSASSAPSFLTSGIFQSILIIMTMLY